MGTYHMLQVLSLSFCLQECSAQGDGKGSKAPLKSYVISWSRKFSLSFIECVGQYFCFRHTWHWHVVAHCYGQITFWEISSAYTTNKDVRKEEKQA